nr:(2Fe-2S)-binding protein [Brevibacillus massiliensis]
MQNRKSLSFRFDGNTYMAYESETIAAALLANGVRTLRVHEEKGTPRGIYCNIGHCFECRVTVNGVQGKRACLTLVEEGMNVESSVQLPSPLKKGGEHR